MKLFSNETMLAFFTSIIILFLTENVTCIKRSNQHRFSSLSSFKLRQFRKQVEESTWKSSNILFLRAFELLLFSQSSNSTLSLSLNNYANQFLKSLSSTTTSALKLSDIEESEAFSEEESKDNVKCNQSLNSDDYMNEKYNNSLFLSSFNSSYFFEEWSYENIKSYLSSSSWFQSSSSNNTDTLITSLSSRFLSEESARAVTKISNILSKFGDHGVIDVFKEYPSSDVVYSILALSRLQRLSNAYQEQFLDTSSISSLDEKNENFIASVDTPFFTDTLFGSRRLFSLRRLLSRRRLSSNKQSQQQSQQYQAVEVNDIALLKRLAYYSIFANIAYGWKMRLALSGKLHLGNLNLLRERTGVDENDIVAFNFKSKTNRPAYFIVRDLQEKSIVLSIRGTLSPRDVLTDLCCTAQPLQDDVIVKDQEEQDYMNYDRAHEGMVEAAKGVAKATYDIVSKELNDHKDFNLVIVGHSLGGGVAACLGTLWKSTFPGKKVSVFAYGCPCVGPKNVEPTSNLDIISIVGEGDPFSSLSLGHIADISIVISHLCTNSELRNEILSRSKDENILSKNNQDWNWCFETMQNLRKNYMNCEKFYPPGRILFMGGAVYGNDGEVTLRDVPTTKFDEITIKASMADISKHVPNRYEAALQRLWSDTLLSSKSNK